jgi:hypothetical protein
MLLQLPTTVLLALLLSSCVSSTDMKECRNDACLKSFEEQGQQAQRYCDDHPDRFSMAPAPSWAVQCESEGRLNNKRQRLASACSCLWLKSTASGEIADHLAEFVLSVDLATTSTTTIYLSATLTEATSSSVVDGQSLSSMVQATAATTTGSEDGILEVTV